MEAGKCVEPLYLYRKRPLGAELPRPIPLCRYRALVQLKMEYQNPDLKCGDLIEVVESDNNVVPETTGEVTHSRFNQYTGQEIIHARIEGHEYQLKSTSTKDVLTRPFGFKCGRDKVAIARKR